MSTSTPPPLAASRQEQPAGYCPPPPRPTTAFDDTLYATNKKVLTMHIDSYKEATKLAANGMNIKSPKLDAGGHSWHILVYPNGRLPGTTDSMSLFLQLADAPDDGGYVKFEYQFMLEIHSGDSHGLEFMSGGVVAAANKRWNAHGFERFVSREDLGKRGFVKADRFQIRCDVIVLEKKPSMLPVVETPPPSGQPSPATETAPPGLSGSRQAPVERAPRTATSRSSPSPSWRMEIP